MKVDVYYNLHKKCLSVRHKGKVIRHCDSVIIEGAKFIVSQRGRERVLQEKRKNVHAYVRGELKEGPDTKCRAWHLVGRRVFYDPYKYDSFVLSDKTPVTGAERVEIHDNRVYAWGLNKTI